MSKVLQSILLTIAILGGPGLAQTGSINFSSWYLVYYEVRAELYLTPQIGLELGAGYSLGKRLTLSAGPMYFFGGQSSGTYAAVLWFGQFPQETYPWHSLAPLVGYRWIFADGSFQVGVEGGLAFNLTPHGGTDFPMFPLLGFSLGWRF